MSKPIIEFTNLTVFRGERRVFANLSLSVLAGECVAVIGPNGSGKTTLLKLLSREIYPVVHEKASLRLFGEEQINIWQLREKVGFVSPEFQNQYETLATGYEVVLSAFFGSVGLYKHHDATDEQRQKADEALEALGLTELRNKQFLKLSSGQQRRLLLARAMVHKPELLVFDEPTNNLDISGAFHLIEDMRLLAKRGVSIVLVTHHIHEIIPEIGRVVGLYDGRIQFDGPKESIITSQNMSALFKIPLHVSQHKGYFQCTPD